MPLLLCPNCQVGMREVQRNDVVIDICPQCQGAWLDRGELQKMLNTMRDIETEWEREREEIERERDAYRDREFDPRRAKDLGDYRRGERLSQEAPIERHAEIKQGSRDNLRREQKQLGRHRSIKETLGSWFD